MGIYKNLDLRDKSNFIKFYALGPMQNSSKPALFVKKIFKKKKTILNIYIYIYI